MTHIIGQPTEDERKAFESLSKIIAVELRDVLLKRGLTAGEALYHLLAAAWEIAPIQDTTLQHTLGGLGVYALPVAVQGYRSRIAKEAEIDRTRAN